MATVIAFRKLQNSKSRRAIRRPATQHLQDVGRPGQSGSAKLTRRSAELLGRRDLVCKAVALHHALGWRPGVGGGPVIVVDKRYFLDRRRAREPRATPLQ